MSWNLSSVKRQPPWQAKQLAWPAKSAKPRFAAAGIAASSPATQASNGAGPGSSVRSKAAIAVTIASMSTLKLGSAAANCAALGQTLRLRKLPPEPHASRAQQCSGPQRTSATLRID